jgi:uncharacterized protein YciI
MIFVSNVGAYKIVAKHGGFDRLTNTELGGGFIVEFRADVLNVHMDMLRALQSEGRLKFNGMARDPSSNMELDPAERCSSFDTEKEISDPELRAEVEQALLSNLDFGKAYWLYEQRAAAAPWPAYDKLVVQGRRTVENVAEKIALMTLDMGLDPEDVLAYEREHLNRPQVVETLEGLSSTEAEEEELITA